jgi:polysaccharide export outer membrane protein
MRITTRAKSLFTPLSLVVLAGLSGGGTAANTPTTNTPTTKTPTANTSAQTNGSSDVDHPVAAQRNPRYKICRNDTLTITFPIAPEFDQLAITVMPDGYVNLQGAGSVYVLGLTVPETVEALKKAYSGILHDPVINVDLTDFQKPYFVVLGQVGKPGQYDLRYDITVMQAVAVAGGFAPTAKTQVFLFHQISPTTVEVKKLNIKEIMNGKNVNEQVHLTPGDTIFVPEKAITNFRKYVPYTVGAGYYPSAAF